MSWPRLLLSGRGRLSWPPTLAHAALSGRGLQALKDLARYDEALKADAEFATRGTEAAATSGLAQLTFPNSGAPLAQAKDCFCSFSTTSGREIGDCGCATVGACTRPLPGWTMESVGVSPNGSEPRSAHGLTGSPPF